MNNAVQMAMLEDLSRFLIAIFSCKNLLCFDEIEIDCFYQIICVLQFEECSI